jgi:hypothetical protein
MLSRDELAKLTEGSVDPSPLGRITRPHDNVELTDEELRVKIEDRNAQRKPTYLLRMEYERRLHQRNL